MKPRQRIASLAAGIFALSLAGLLPGAAQGSDPLNQQQPVAEPFNDPVYEGVCHLYIRRRVGLVFTLKFTGSAVLYRGRYLLTAGHNVYQDHSRIRDVAVRCGNADARHAKVDEVIERWQALDASGYDGSPFTRDFGVIRLRNPITTAAPFTLATSPAHPGEAVRFAGFPGEKHDGWHLFAATGRVTTAAPGLIHYDIETYKSNSGGPIWREVNGQRELLAIHVMPSGGRAVDADFRAEVERLIAELDRSAETRP